MDGGSCLLVEGGSYLQVDGCSYLLVDGSVEIGKHKERILQYVNKNIGMHAVPLGCMHFHQLACSSLKLKTAHMQLHDLRNSLQFHEVTKSYQIFCLSSSQELRSACYDRCIYGFGKGF